VTRPDRQVAHPRHRALLDLDRRAAAPGAAAGTRDQLELEVEPAAHLNDALHLEPLEPDEAANVVVHPLFLLAPQFMTTRSLEGAADVSIRPSTPFVQQDPSFRPAPTASQVAAKRGRRSSRAGRCRAAVVEQAV
jgi:hypothetical protein